MATYQVLWKSAHWFRGRRLLKGLYHILGWRPSCSSDLDAANKLSFPLPPLWRFEDTRKRFLDENRHGLVDENRVNNKENKNNRAVFMLYLFAYNIKPMPK